MRLLYATSIIFPSPMANRLQVLSMAGAFGAKLGDDFLLGVSDRSRQMTERFQVERFQTEGRSILLSIRYLSFAWKRGFTHIFCREEKLLFFMILYSKIFFWKRKIAFIFEVHHLEEKKAWWFHYVLSSSSLLITITEGLARKLKEEKISADPILVAPDAVDAELFNIPETKAAAREKLVLPQDKKIVLYSGSLEAWKGVDVLYKSSLLVEDPNVIFIIVGGKKSWIEEFQGWYPPKENFLMLGNKDHDQIPLYLRAADVLVLPNLSTFEISRISTSPMKLFEYMASGTPIVASDLPSIREILSDELAFLVKPDSPVALKEGIEKVFSNFADANDRAKQAKIKVANFTWQNRARSIIDFIRARS